MAKFCVEEETDLIALHRVFREAKFCIQPDDEEISDSPIVARLFEKLTETVITAEIEKRGEKAGAEWLSWLDIDNTRDEWTTAAQRAKRYKLWSALSKVDKDKYVKILLSPFILSEEKILQFIQEVERLK